MDTQRLEEPSQEAIGDGHGSLPGPAARRGKRMARFRIAEETPPFSQSNQTIRESNNRCERPVLEISICSHDRAAVGDYSTLAPIAVTAFASMTSRISRPPLSIMK
jgi:hypothetical protein